ncbi:ferredoxin--NADP+ reductase/benzoate/toluate 1,2-dioxygenase reductase subunit [Mariniphaga anaerophila]|uniref:Ferredoxin--NADP+ reductase/benzoate/toluate 1,2-dioxygenase reductase subunit n=1 Tax=Mariniphaga anaerophila TaxID=1484053 RepID=A0A1M5DGI5_9BACT|nr:FAD-binding oxidoreductase [Mariniphaga anaerophila]SHF66080.1 ferredoxin--NADP+ reductase/benzoate/toluate 1,2-dioxygenase reductase subunit [Mariniphaga anaerophila]
MKKHKIIAVRHLTKSTFVLRIERKGLPFQTGQFVILRRPGTIEQREYSVYSGEQDDYLEVLVREVTSGKVTPRLKKMKPGDELEIDGPHGFFRFQPTLFPVQKFLFLATGTGISPFHSFVKTYSELNYKLVHGVRFREEAYEHQIFEKQKITLCTSVDKTGDFNGRITDYLCTQELDNDTQCFLCGNSAMIYEAFDILTGKGIPVRNIYSEVYF